MFIFFLLKFLGMHYPSLGKERPSWPAHLGLLIHIPGEGNGVVGDLLDVPDGVEALLVISCNGKRKYLSRVAARWHSTCLLAVHLGVKTRGWGHPYDRASLRPSRDTRHPGSKHSYSTCRLNTCMHTYILHTIMQRRTHEHILAQQRKNPSIKTHYYFSMAKF